MRLLCFYVVLAAVFTAMTVDPVMADPGFYQILDKARKGDVRAMCDLGQAYFYGKGTLKDPFKAKCWIKKADAAGSTKAEGLWEALELWKYSGSCDDAFDDEVLPEYSKGDSYFDPLTQTSFVYLPDGCFVMGCKASQGKCRKDQIPSRKICVEGFWIGSYEVTQRLWQQVMHHNPSRFSDSPDHPVENISYDDALYFIRTLNSKGKDQYQVPTEAQWEYACKKGRQGADQGLDSDCVTCEPEQMGVQRVQTGTTLPVGSFTPNAIGLYDMAGNVKEWCRDVYSKKAYRELKENNPVYRKKGVSRVVRGGSFADSGSKKSCISRDKSIPAMRSQTIGLRLILHKAE